MNRPGHLITARWKRNSIIVWFPRRNYRHGLRVFLDRNTAARLAGHTLPALLAAPPSDLGGGLARLAVADTHVLLSFREAEAVVRVIRARLAKKPPAPRPARVTRPPRPEAGSRRNQRSTQLRNVAAVAQLELRRGGLTDDEIDHLAVHFAEEPAS